MALPFFIQPMKVLVTGADGQIGSELVRALNDENDFSATGSDADTLDITNASAVSARLDTDQPDYIVNCAGFNHVAASERNRERAFKVNAEGAGLLASQCAERNIPLLHLSSDYVFDGHYGSGYSENDEVSPLGAFGESKWQGEQLIRDQLESYIILRVSWIFSAYGDSLLRRTLEQARTEELMRAVDDRRGCPTSSADVARVLVAILKQLSNGAKAFGTFHYCSAEPTTRYGFSEAILAAARQYEELRVRELIPVASADIPDAAERPVSAVLKCSRLTNAYGIRQRPWRGELQRLIAEIYAERNPPGTLKESE